MLFSVAISNNSVINFSLRASPETNTSPRENPVGQVMPKAANAKQIDAFERYTKSNNEYTSFCNPS